MESGESDIGNLPIASVQSINTSDLGVAFTRTGRTRAWIEDVVERLLGSGVHDGNVGPCAPVGARAPLPRRGFLALLGWRHCSEMRLEAQVAVSVRHEHPYCGFEDVLVLRLVCSFFLAVSRLGLLN